MDAVSYTHLDVYKRQVGEPRKPGEPEPAQFARPADTVEIERKAGFGPKIGD